MYKFQPMRPPLPGDNPGTTDESRYLGKVQRQVVIEEAI